MGAELRCRAIGATAGRLSAYLFERCGSEAAQLCAHAVHSGGGLGWAQVSRFFVSKASEAAQGGVGGLFICLRWRSAILRESSSLWQVSQTIRETILCKAPSDAHRHWFTHRPRAGVARTDIIRIWPLAPHKRARTQPLKRSPGSALTANSHPRNDERGLRRLRKAHTAL